MFKKKKTKAQEQEDALAELRALPRPAMDFTTPEGAILCLEDAYRRRDLEAACAPMDDPAEIELRRQCRISLRNIRRTALLLGIPALGILVLQHFVSVNLWAPFVVVAVLSLTTIGDLVTYVRSRRKLRKDEPHARSQPRT